MNTEETWFMFEEGKYMSIEEAIAHINGNTLLLLKMVNALQDKAEELQKQVDELTK